ncbi:MAG: quinone oxidoreductase [Actinobacteria bacterium]|nr:quinone oxidoreductase [Actinomycetota bacterium]
MHAIRLATHGGPEVLSWDEVPDLHPGEGQIRVQVAAAGVNYIDTYHRRGLYPVDLPLVLGLEGAGVVDAVGGGVRRWKVGDRVAWTSARGSYAEQTLVAADQAVAVPEGVDLEIAAATMLQGMTAHYLVHDTYPLRQGELCLVHAGAGGVGRLLIQMAVQAGARVFATAGTSEKRRIAESLGAEVACDYSEFVQVVEETAGRRPLHVIYDGVGRTTFLDGLALMRIRGMVVLFGQSSGPVEPFDLQELSRNGSLYVTRPSLFHHIASPDELEHRAGEVFRGILDGWLNVAIGQRFAMSDAAAAHLALEGRRTTGKVLLIP